MAQRVLAENASVQSVSYSLPNKHYIPVDMKYIGLENLKPFVVTSLIFSHIYWRFELLVTLRKYSCLSLLQGITCLLRQIHLSDDLSPPVVWSQLPFRGSKKVFQGALRVVWYYIVIFSELCVTYFDSYKNLLYQVGSNARGSAMREARIVKALDKSNIWDVNNLGPRVSTLLSVTTTVLWYILFSRVISNTPAKGISWDLSVRTSFLLNATRRCRTCPWKIDDCIWSKWLIRTKGASDVFTNGGGTYNASGNPKCILSHFLSEKSDPRWTWGLMKIAITKNSFRSYSKLYWPMALPSLSRTSMVFQSSTDTT
jgi:hypothetical protein